MTTTQLLTEADKIVGTSIPPGTAHAVSVSLPSWKANVAYEEGEDWVLSKMRNGYPRFFIHKSIEAFAADIVRKHGRSGEEAFLFPSHAIASRCSDFLRAHASIVCSNLVRIVDLVTNSTMNSAGTLSQIPLTISAVIIPRALYGVAKAFWQHTGDGVSSRRAEFCHQAFNNGSLVDSKSSSSGVRLSRRSCKGPKRYQRAASVEQTQAHPSREPNGVDKPRDISDRLDYIQFVEERFGRNLDLSFVKNAKLAVKRRIAGSLTANVDLEEALEISSETNNGRQIKDLSENDVYLYPTGMSAIFNTHRMLMAVRGPLRSICFGFSYIDTLKVLEKFGPGCLFYGHGSLEDLNDLEHRLEQGERFLALFCEFPSNPLLKTPDLQRIRGLATTYDFAIVIDETIGNFMNVHVLAHADAVVSSLTKVFSGDSNVMGGSCVLNPHSLYYRLINDNLSADYEDNYWVEDAIFMERNSRDFVSRIERINANAEAICDVLRASPDVSAVYYPKYSSSRCYYDQFRNPHGGYGGLLSITFNSAAEAASVFDALETAKGPSLGTNFTLSSPYAILAHYAELDWAASFGVDANLIRVSVGLEAAADLCAIFERALMAIAAV